MYSRPISNIFFTAFDLETTGLYPDRDSIIEIGAVRFNLNGEQYRFSGLIDPGRSIPEEATRVNGISDEMVAGMPSIEEILPGFLEFIDDSVLIAHNIGFDAGFIAAAAARQDLKLRDNHCIDTVMLGKKCYAGLYSYSLGSLSSALGISIENAHRAEDDAEACMEIFLKCAARLPGYPHLTLKELFRKAGLRSRTLSISG